MVPFEREFRGTSEETPRFVLDTLLAAPSELSGLLNKALDMLPEVQRRGVDVTPTMQRALSEFRQTSDPFAAWLDRNIPRRFPPP